VTVRLALLATTAVPVLLFSAPVVPTRGEPIGLPVAEANDNRRAAGRLRGDTLFLDLDIRMARWYPEARDGAFVEDAIIGERGRKPQVPSPLIRVREGTTVVARLTNTLADSSVTWHGLTTRPGMDSVRLVPGESMTVRFVAGRPGTYAYRAQVGHVDWKTREREQNVGAFVVDAPGAPTDDRILVMNAWGEERGSDDYRNALAINGRGWPYTERMRGKVGESQRWRVVNGTIRVHPMHLHGFYYRITAQGDGSRDSTFAPDEQPLVVTERMRPFSTMTMEWTPERAGNWLFHCHLSFHVVPETRYTPYDVHAAHYSADARQHMAGLVLGIEVGPGKPEPAEDRRDARTLRLVVQEGPRRGRAPRAMSFVLQQDAEPARDSVVIPGTPLILVRGQPTDIRVVNHLNEATAVHWHGIELESWSDGVAGWSGAMNRLAPAIAPGDSFTARLTLPRAGTFIYHTHLNDIEQLTSGLYGPIVVLEPGQSWDPRTDHLLTIGWDGDGQPAHLLVNGDSTPPPLVLERGVEHRLRFVFIGAVGGNPFRLMSDTTMVTWRALARDGAELPAHRQVEVPALTAGWAGQTFDFGFRRDVAGEYRLVAGNPTQPRWVRTVIVR
jgi:FtsP/CotA-like multicopper oxidase with cupredoxin domain